MDIKTLALIFAIVAVALAGFLLFQTQVMLSEVSTAVSQIPEPEGTTSSSSSTSTTISSSEPPSELVLTQLPESVNDFERSEFLPRIEPLLAGEEYSSLARFVPLEESEFFGVVEGVRIMFYRFESEEALSPGLSVYSLGNTLGSFSFQGHEILWYYDEVTVQNIYFLIAGSDLIHVLSAARHKDEPNPDVMEAAALNVIAALLEVNQ